MEKVQKLIENNKLFEKIVQMMYISSKDMEIFDNEPIEYIGKESDFKDTIFSPKNQVQILLRKITAYQNERGIKKMQYLKKFIDFIFNNFCEYTTKAENSNNGIDWRIKESLMVCICTIHKEVWKYPKELIESIEEILVWYVLNELQSKHPIMRARAC